MSYMKCGKAQADLAVDVFLALVGERPESCYVEEDEVRSAPYTDTVDVKVGDQWYRISSTPIDEPISVKAHRNEAG